jgi:hypothetical protein
MYNEKRKRPTMPVPEAGRRYFDLGRNASYDAARRGEIPTIRIGSRLFAVVAALDRMVGDAGNFASQTDRPAAHEPRREQPKRVTAPAAPPATTQPEGRADAKPRSSASRGR